MASQREETAFPASASCLPSTSKALQWKKHTASMLATKTARKIKNVIKSTSLQCAICGDKPTGYHYDVLSCTGCKTFFRRTVVEKRTFTCSKDGMCMSNKDVRCSCRACRFNKCISAGMNVKSIQFPTRAVRRDTRSCSIENDPKPLHTEVVREQYANDMREHYNMFSSDSLVNVLQLPPMLGATQFSTRFKERAESLKAGYSMNPIRYWMIADLHLITEYAKSFPAFNALSTSDQRALLSHSGGILLLLTQSFYSKAKQLGTTTFPDGVVALEAVETKRCCKYVNHGNSPWISDVFSYPVYLLRNLGVDAQLYALLRAIALFSPLDDEISAAGRWLIQKEREKLMDAISRFIIAKEGPLNGPLMLVSLMSILQKLYQLNEKRRSQLNFLDITCRLQLSLIGREIFLRQRKFSESVLQDILLSDQMELGRRE